MDAFQVYKDMKARTNGEIYIGVVGPVRTGKSTFIKRFMDLLVLPNMTDEHAKERTKDELPQSASGTTIMTTEPKFVPKDAASVRLSEDVEVKIRLIDCVGYMVDGASGHIENDVERQVKTPWFEHEIPFTKAAAIGTQKVIHDHATIGLVITTDGSIGELPRENYILAEEKTIQELKSIGKPFLILLNTQKPYSEETKSLQGKMEEKYGVSVLAVNCAQLRTEDINQIMRQVLYEFPISEAEFLILKDFDLAELKAYEQARDLTVDLLKEWLVKYKFKNWDWSESRNCEVTNEMKEERAKKIAEKLGNNNVWHSHGRPIDIDKLTSIGLKIKDFEEDKEVHESIREFHNLMIENMEASSLNAMVLTKEALK